MSLLNRSQVLVDKVPDYDSPEMDKLVEKENVEALKSLGRRLNATEEHLFRQWHSGYPFSTVGD